MDFNRAIIVWILIEQLLILARIFYILLYLDGETINQ